MSENTFTPHTRQQDEREIVREQKDFSSGIYRDIPATEVPETGLVDLKNFRDHGSYLEGRTGSKRWGDYSSFTESASLPVLTSGYTTTSLVSGNERTITATVGDSFSDYDVGDYYIHDDGTNERITEIISSTEITTYTESDEEKSSVNGKIRGKINGLFFHSYSRKVILVIKKKIYISNDYTITAWRECALIANNGLSNSVCTFGELNKYLLIFNANGIYRLNTYDDPYYVYKVNSDVPSELLTSVNPESVYLRRFTYTFSRLSGTGLLRNRLTAGVTLIQESGNVEANETNKDYTDHYSASSFGSENLVSGLTNGRNLDGVPDQHWTHYSIYATLDIGNNGFDPVKKEVNNSEVYIWLDDISIAKPFDLTISGTDCISSVPVFSYSDKDSIVHFYDTNTNNFSSATIDSISSQTQFTTTLPIGDVTSQPACIGAKLPFALTQSSGVINYTKSTSPVVVTFNSSSNIVEYNIHPFETGDRITFNDDSGTMPIGISSNTDYFVIDSSLNYFKIAETYNDAINGTEIDFSDNGSGTITIDYSYLSSADVNKTIYLSNGDYRVIKSVSGGIVSVYENSSEYNIDSSVIGVIDPNGRNYTDKTSDDTLRTRDGDPFFLLSLRFYKPLPSSDIGEIEAGFVFTAKRNESYVYYSSVPENFEYYIGYYHPRYQIARFKGLIRAIKSLSDRLVVYLANSTYTVPLNVFDTVDLRDIGLIIPVISGQTLADSSIGLLDYGSLVNLDIGKHIMITNEPAIRIFDGDQFSENIASQRFMDTLRSLQVATSAIYDPRIGYNFWGLDE